MEGNSKDSSISKPRRIGRVPRRKKSGKEAKELDNNPFEYISNIFQQTIKIRKKVIYLILIANQKRSRVYLWVLNRTFKYFV